MEFLDNLWVRIQNTNRKLLENYQQDAHAELPYFKNDLYSSLQEKYFEAHGVIYEFLEAIAPKVATVPSSSNQSNNTPTQAPSQIIIQKDNYEIPLPRIHIPTFAGGYQDWISFRDLFEGLIHNNRNLSKVQKLHYLQSALSGEAKQLIRHLQISEVNYEPAWELLKRRYQNERALINAQLQALMSLPTQNLETATNIKKFLDNLNECLEGLKALKIDITSWNHILIFILTQKLHRETVAQWELALSNRINPIELPTLTEFTEFLEGRFRTLDAICRAKGHQPHKENLSKTNYRLSPEQHTAQAFTINASSMCPICNQDHRLKQCVKFLKMSPKNRYEFIRNSGRCINCLSKAHSVKECPTSMNCHHCQKRHNSLLHFNSAPQDQRSPVFQQHSHRNIMQHSQRSAAKPSQFRAHHIAQNQIYQDKEGMRFQTTQPENINKPILSQCNHYPTDYNNSPSLPTTSLNAQNELSIQAHFAHKNQYATVLLATAIVNIDTSNGGRQLIRVLLDQGSQASFITEDAVQKLGLNKRPAYANVSGISDSHGIVSRGMVSCLIQSRYKTAFIKAVEAYVLSKITGRLPNQHVEPDSLPYLDGLQLADPQFSKPGHIDMLLGADIFADILLPGVIKGPNGYPVAQKTLFGWIISGRIPINNTSKNIIPNISLNCNTSELLELEMLLRKFWEVEDLPLSKILKPEEELCEEIYEKLHYRRPDGRYVVPLTFKNDTPPQFGESWNVAKRRLLQMEKKFEKNPKLFEDYKAFMDEYISLGHMEKIKTGSTNSYERGNTHEEFFLPHHAVIKESSTTTKLRVVFDASSKSTNHKSLNDMLLAGPSLQQELYNILTRWRTYPIAITADIEKMYRQIYIEPSHLPYQKILWRDNPNNPIEEYKLLTVTYGTSCAPYLAIRTIVQLAHDKKNEFPIASQRLLSDFYVDDLLTGAYTLDEAVQVQKQVRHVLSSGGFNLRKWASNSESLLSHIPAKDREIAVPFNIEFDSTIKALGIHWNAKDDTFGFKVSLGSVTRPVTKRSLLSEASRLFDPLGWLAPTIIMAKVMFQRLWIDGLNWDDPLPPTLQNQWLQFREELPKLEPITIPRWIKSTNHNMTIELHAFCDASTFAYAAVVYSRCILNSGQIIVTLLGAKTKVAPIKQISVPRLELCGAHLLSNLAAKIKSSLNFPNVKTVGWTDSLNVLAWLRGHPRQWQTFVANRVSQIQESKSIDHWNYVKSADNPADCASRGVIPGELHKHPLWWTGPH